MLIPSPINVVRRGMTTIKRDKILIKKKKESGLAGLTLQRIYQLLKHHFLNLYLYTSVQQIHVSLRTFNSKTSMNFL